jgi:hypothetical protein
MAAVVAVLVGLPIAMLRPAAARSSAPEDRLACPASEATRPNGPGAATIWTAPLEPAAGKPLRVLAVSEASLADTELVITSQKSPAETSRLVRRTGPPFAIEARVAAPQTGKVRIELRKGGKDIACRIVEVAAKGHRPAVARAVGPGTWVSARAWDRTTESFYAAWIESLFDAPLSETLGFRPLAQALRDPDRNWLHDYLGLGEDDPKAKTALVAAPDCADLPYFSRAYFSWKLGLPYGFRDCDRGTDTRPPRCGGLVTNESLIEGAPRDALGAMKKFLRVLANKVHSGSARTALKDDDTDYYPVALSRDALRPGTVFADPYGHVLMSVKWVPQERDTGGILLAVDGQPDGSVGRKRFWEGTFLYANDIAGAGPGWKRFRPLVKGPDGKLVQLSNAALAADERFPAFSTEQASLARDDFYARMGKLINPKGLDAAAAYGETLDALVEQLQTRVGSVDNGEKYMRENASPVIPMPDGAKIFETVGAWEDYATPSRDMRLLIAIHVLETLPERVVSHPELFNLGARKPDVVRAEVERLHATRAKERSIEYVRSDGSKFKLTVADVIARKAGFEMAYNPNDCIETRWAAPAGSPEASTCKRHEPDDQMAKMKQYRAWFHDMRRPAR